MRCLRVKVCGVPEPVFACSVTTENYDWKNENEEKCLEIGILEGKSVVSSVEGEDCTYPECALIVVAGGEDISSRSVRSETVYINTISVRFSGLEWEIVNVSDVDMSDTEYFLFPCYVDISEDKQHYLRLVKTYISHYARNARYDRAMCVSIWFEIAANIDRMFRSMYETKPFFASEFYVKKVNSIIARDFSKGLNITDIAAELGVTPNYLSSVYRKGAGITITQATNLVRMQHARELAYEGRLTTQEIAEKVGLHDEGYLRKLFKRTWGVNINECRLIDHEITLYHPKPWQD